MVVGYRDGRIGPDHAVGIAGEAPSAHDLTFFFFQAEDGIRDYKVTGVQTCALPICKPHVHPADLSDLDDIERLANEVIAEYGGIDILVNNAGRSIRRSLKASYDRFHDYERTMQLNYFGALRLILSFMPGMRERKTGHVINISSIGVQTNTPRFSPYVASKAALDAFSR